MIIQTKKNRILRLAALLCLLALTVGCMACAIAYASSIDESVASVDSVDTVTLDGSDSTESDTELSEEPGRAAGEISVDQSAEELMVPAGTKTTVEKIASYPIGENEAFQYIFMIYGTADPEDALLPELPITARIDENEDLYLAYWFSTVTRLRDGKQWKSTHSWETDYSGGSCQRFVISGEYLYMVFDNGVVEQYDMEGNLVELYTGCVDGEVNAKIPYVDADGQVYLKVGNQNHYCRLDGTDISGDRTPLRVGTAKTETQFAPSTQGGLVSSYGPAFVKAQTEYIRSNIFGSGSYEQIYSTYHVDGTLLSNLHFLSLRSTEKSPCSFPYGIKYTHFATVCIDDIVFEHVLDGDIVAGANGLLYLVLYLENEVELYRITPGHTDGLKLGTLPEQVTADSSVQMQKVTGTQPDEPNAAIPNAPYHISGATYTEVLDRAVQMINLTRTLKATHCKDSTTIKSPKQVFAHNPGDTMKGIPYCYGGYNGLDTVSGGTKFSEAINVPDVIAGNIVHDGGHKSGTVGLDCSGFVSSAYKLDKRKSSFDYRDLGCLATSLSQLRAGDILVTKEGGDARHVMIYAGIEEDIVVVYDCTGAGDVNDQRANRRLIKQSLIESEYYFRVVLISKTCYNSKGHWRGCSLCSTSTLVAPHTYNASKVCTVCGYYGGVTINPGM